MKWTLKEIQEHRDEPIYFSATINREKSLMERDSEILAVSDIKANGFLLYEDHSILANFQIDLTITLPSSRSLEPVEYPMNVSISEVYVEDEEDYAGLEDSDQVVFPIKGHELDLVPAIEDAILLHIPSQVFTEKEKSSNRMPTGNDWTVISEEEYQRKIAKEKEELVDPRLAKLKDFLNDEEEHEE